MKRKSHLGIILVIVVVLLLCCGGTMTLVLLASPAILQGFEGSAGNTVAIIGLEGVITSGAGDGINRGTVYSEATIDDIEAAVENPSVAAIVLDINSPGGSVFASASIYEAVRNCPKPVVARLGEIAASGGYYVACGSDYIVAHPTTLTGSIGVIWEFTNVAELLDILGVQTQVVKSGDHKDEGGYYRPLTEEELQMYQSIVDEAYADFVQVVSEGRDLPEEQVLKLADGRVFSGKQALEAGLVDAEGNLDDAIDIAAQMGGIEGDVHLLRFQRQPGLLDAFLSYFSNAGQPKELAVLDELMGPDAALPQYLYVSP